MVIWLNPLGSNIKKRRQWLGLSQEELAAKVGYKDRATISKVEAGLIDLTQTKISEFALALQTTSSYLMGWDDNADNTVEITNLSNDEYELLFSFKAMPEHEKQILLSYARYLSAKVIEDEKAKRRGFLAAKGGHPASKISSSSAIDSVKQILQKDAENKKMKLKGILKCEI